MQKTKFYYSKKPRVIQANAYAAQIMSDVWEKISEGFECKNITDFYAECSEEDLAEVTDWTHTVFGKELCDSVDQAIDRALDDEETGMSNVFRIVISESSKLPVQYLATLILDDSEHKKKIKLLKNQSTIW